MRFWLKRLEQTEHGQEGPARDGQGRGGVRRRAASLQRSGVTPFVPGETQFLGRTFSSLAHGGAYALLHQEVQMGTGRIYIVRDAMGQPTFLDSGLAHLVVLGKQEVCAACKRRILIPHSLCACESKNNKTTRHNTNQLHSLKIAGALHPVEIVRLQTSAIP